MDRKSGILKEIQGRIWKSGYENGELKSSMFSDVPSFLKKIQASKKKSAVYSSGSIQAQKLIFEYSDFGNLTHFFTLTSTLESEEKENLPVTLKFQNN